MLLFIYFLTIQLRVESQPKNQCYQFAVVSYTGYRRPKTRKLNHYHVCVFFESKTLNRQRPSKRVPQYNSKQHLNLANQTNFILKPNPIIILLKRTQCYPNFSYYSQLSRCAHPAIKDTSTKRTAAKSPAKTYYRRLTKIYFRYWGHPLMRTLP